MNDTIKMETYEASDKPHWLDAAAMLRKAGRDLQEAERNHSIQNEDRTQAYLKSALHNITAALSRFDADIVR